LTDANGQLTADEVASIKDMVLDPKLRHMPLRTLSLYSQRVGRVFASVATWARLVPERGWRRLRNRVHPAKPTEGVRATRPNELWHIDVTILKLLDNTKAYLHAVIDNYSRKVLAWTIASRLDPVTTCNILVAASRHLDSPSFPPTVVADSGVETSTPRSTRYSRHRSFGACLPSSRWPTPTRSSRRGGDP
jgi:transposase InsO family protein